MCAICLCQGPLNSCTATIGGNRPLPQRPPEPDRSQQVARHTGLTCLCALLDCCHNELPEDNYSFRPCGSHGVHAHAGSPASGYLMPWAEGDESWREPYLPFPARHLRVLSRG